MDLEALRGGAHYILSQPNYLTFQLPWCPTPACAASKQELQAWALHTNKVETLIEPKDCHKKMKQ